MSPIYLFQPAGELIVLQPSTMKSAYIIVGAIDGGGAGTIESQIWFKGCEY